MAEAVSLDARAVGALVGEIEVKCAGYADFNTYIEEDTDNAEQPYGGNSKGSGCILSFVHC